MRIKNSNLPDTKVKCVILDANAPLPLLKYFDDNEIRYIKSLRVKNTIDAVSTHPDMQICNVYEGTFVCEPTTYEYYKKELKLFGVNVTKGEKFIKSNYPHDVAYNVVVMGDYFIHNTSLTDNVVMDFVKGHKLCILDTKQGYTMCATCIIDNNAVITDDVGIYKLCCDNEIDCLLIDKDEIILGERTDGFFGGCCGMIGDKKLLFCGDVKRHKNYKEIKTFADKYSVELISAYDGPLTDLGSIIPVVQE